MVYKRRLRRLQAALLGGGLIKTAVGAILDDAIDSLNLQSFGSAFQNDRTLQTSSVNAFQKYERLAHGETGGIQGFHTDVELSVDLGDSNIIEDDWINLLPPLPNEGQQAGISATKIDPAKLRTTGTTIAGICGRDFVVLGADTRATNGQMVADKRCDKIHELADNIFACGAGTSADLEHLTRKILYQNKLQATVHGTIGNEARSGSPANVQDVARVCETIRSSLYQQGGRCSANLVVGGVYEGRAILRAIHPHGSQDALAFTALGSGGLAAMGVLEQGYDESLTLDEAKDLVTRAIRAGVTNDLGSGSQVDLCIITKNGTDKIRCHVPEDSLTKIMKAEDDTSHSIMSSTPGVNGFGNHPFALRKVRTLTVSKDLQRTQETEQWSDLLSKSQK